MILSLSDRLVIVGTSHVARQSKKEITKAYEEFRPDVIAVELDHQRLHALLTNQTSKLSPALIRQIGVTGYLFLVIGSFVQKKIGNLVNMQPGAEMKHAALLSRTHQKKLLLADRPIQVTLHRLSKVWRFREKMKMVWDMIVAPFKKEERVLLDFRGVPDELVVIKLLAFFKKKYPGLYKVLVHERDVHIAAVVRNYQKKFPDDKVLLVIGAGHVRGVRAILEKTTTN